MYRGILRITAMIVICFGVFWVVDSSFRDFANDIQLQNPVDVFDLDVPEFQETEQPDISVQAEDKEEKIAEKPNANQENTIVEKSQKEEKPKKEKEVKKSNLTEDELNKLISTIRVSSESQTAKYNRDDYEKPYEKYNYKGQKLSRNKYAWHVSKHLVKENPFEYYCPYTGLTITDMSTLDFEHIVSLKTVNDNCPSWWTNKEKNEYAYDQLIGVDVLNKANRSKSAKTPSEWLPEVNIEDFCFTYLAICSKYDIAMSKTDIQVCKLEILNAISMGEEITFINQFKEGTKEYEEQLKWYNEIKNL